MIETLSVLLFFMAYCLYMETGKPLHRVLPLAVVTLAVLAALVWLYARTNGLL